MDAKVTLYKSPQGNWFVWVVPVIGMPQAFPIANESTVNRLKASGWPIDPSTAAKEH